MDKAGQQGMMKVLKKNAVFIIIVCIAIVCVIKRNDYQKMPIVSAPDSELVFSTEESVLEQTWQPQVKRIAGVRIPYVSASDFESDLKLTVYSDDYAEILASVTIHQTFQTDASGTLRFDFKTVQVVPGERYRIRLSYDTFSADGALRIASGRNYDGCSIGEVACREAAALYVTIVKSSSLFWILAVFFPFIAFSLLFMIVWTRKWEECIGISVIITVFILYVAGLFEILTAGMALVYILAFAAFGLSVYYYNKKDMQAKDLFSPAIVVYAIFFLVIPVNCRNVWFARWDEYSHWGTAVKDMFYFDSFAKHVNTTVMLPRYVPFSTLIEYFFVHAKGMFSPDMVYIAFQTTLLSLLMIVCGAVGKKKKYLVPSIAVMFIIPVIFFGDVYNCIYVDSMMAVLAAYVLICYFTEELAGFNLLRILGALFALTMTKDMGFVIAGLLTAVMMGDSLYLAFMKKNVERKDAKTSKFLQIIKGLFRPLLCAVFVLAVFMSWQVYMSIPAKAPVPVTRAAETWASEEQDAVGEKQASEGAVTDRAEAESAASANAAQSEEKVYFQGTVGASRLSINEILKLFKHEDGGYRYQAIKNYLITIFDEASFRFGNIRVSYVDAYILLLLLTGVLALFDFWGGKIGRMFSFGIFTFLAGMGYSFVLELMYLFAFPQGEALILSSHVRYHGSFLGAVVLALACLIVRQAAAGEEEDTEKAKKRSYAVMAALTAFLIICMPVESLIEKNMDTEITEADVYGYADMGEVFRSFALKSEKIYYVCNDGNGESYYIFCNVVSPLLCVNYYAESDIYGSEEAYEEEMTAKTEAGEEMSGNGRIMSCGEWEGILQDCQYVFLMHPGRAFAESYGELFAEPDTIGDRTFYRVRQDDEDVTLEYIGQVGVKSY